MKRYIFFTDSVAGVGGGQLYVADKARRLSIEGWKVEIFTINGGKVVLSAFYDFPYHILPELSLRFNATPRRLRESVAAIVESGWHDDDEIVIEAYNISTSFWAEYIAERWNGTAIVYLLAELTRSHTSFQLDFLRFKLRQGLLYGITRHNIPDIFSDADADATFLQALGCGVNAYQGETHKRDESEKREGEKRDNSLPAGFSPSESFTTLFVSRLDKPGVKETLDEVRAFAMQYPDIACRLIVVGDAEDASCRISLQKMMSGVANLECDFLGYLFPIPQAVFDMSDVAVGTSGSIRVAHDGGVPAITVDVEDYQAIGIFCETTMHRMYRGENEPPVRISALMKSVYDDVASGRRSRLSRDSARTLTKDDSAIWLRHKEVLRIRQHQYYDLSTLRPLGFKEYIYRLLLSFGIRPRRKRTNFQN